MLCLALRQTDRHTHTLANFSIHLDVTEDFVLACKYVSSLLLFLSSHLLSLHSTSLPHIPHSLYPLQGLFFCIRLFQRSLPFPVSSSLFVCTTFLLCTYCPPPSSSAHTPYQDVTKELNTVATGGVHVEKNLSQLEWSAFSSSGSMNIKDRVPHYPTL